PGGATAGPVWSFTTAAAPVVDADLLIQDSFTGANGTLLTAHLPEFERTAAPWVSMSGPPVPTLANGFAGITPGAGHVQAAVETGNSNVLINLDYRAGSAS